MTERHTAPSIDPGATVVGPAMAKRPRHALDERTGLGHIERAQTPKTGYATHGFASRPTVSRRQPVVQAPSTSSRAPFLARGDQRRKRPVSSCAPSLSVAA